MVSISVPTIHGQTLSKPFNTSILRLSGFFKSADGYATITYKSTIWRILAGNQLEKEKLCPK